jgi:hypothetical protein
MIIFKVTEKEKKKFKNWLKKNDMTVSAFIQKRIDGYNPIIITGIENLIEKLDGIKRDNARFGNLMISQDKEYRQRLKVMGIQGSILKELKEKQEEKRQKYFDNISEIKKNNQ